MSGILQWTTEDHEVFVGESIHEQGMFVPSLLFSHQTLVISRWSCLVDYDEVRHAFFLWYQLILGFRLLAVAY